MQDPRTIKLLACGCLAVAAAVTGSSIGGTTAPDARVDGHSTVWLNNGQSPVGMYEHDGRMMRLYGKSFSHGASPEASAEAFLAANAEFLGVDVENLRDQRLQPIMYDWDTATYKFTGVNYAQYVDDVPVFRGQIKLLVRNETGYPLVLAATDIRDVGNLNVDPAARNDGAGRKAASNMFPDMEFTDPELVVWAGVDDMFVPPALATTFVGETVPGAAEYQKWLFVVDAATGGVLYLEDQVHNVDVEGNVSGRATQGLGADICGPEEPEFLPYARVNIGGTVAFADENGDFVIPNGGNSDVTVESPVRGRWFRVFNESGPETVLSQIVTPPGPADFMHNDANNSEFIRAEVNAYFQANIVRDFTLVQNPAYPVIANQSEFTVNVNIASNCNAFYNGSSINFYTSGGGCPNTAFSDVVHHEYGHHLVNVGGSGQGAYGEGMGDVMGVLIEDDPILGQGFQNNCGVGIRDARNNLQYPCSGPIHFCGQLISGCVWDTRNALIITNPGTYLEIISNLAVNAILLHNGTNITPAITIDYLTLDDDDENIGNGTPHYQEIAAGFGAHNMDAPPIQIIGFEFPNGLPEQINPSGGTTARVEVVGISGSPEPGTGKLFFDDGNGVVEYDMDQVSDNVYDAVFPATDCPIQVSYYFSALSTDDFEQFSPPGAPIDRFQAIAAVDVSTTFEDDFEADQGWTVVTDATTGAWQRGTPTGGDRGDPPSDGDGSGQCYVTGLAGGDNDIDDGSTVLTSPVMDASDPGSLLSYYRWYSNTFGADPENDIFVIEVSPDGGATWDSLETVGPTGEEVNGGWFFKEFLISDFTENTDEFMVRFNASDLNAGSVVEAGVDGVEVNVFSCEGGCSGDVDGSGEVDFDDVLLILAAWGPCDEDCPEDLDDDNDVDFDDLLIALAGWGPCE